MSSRRARVSFAERTGVLPDSATCQGPRTELAGLKDRTWPTTSESKIIRSAARCCLMLAGESAAVSCSMQAATIIGSTWSRARPRSSHHPENRRTAARYRRRVFGFRMRAVKSSRKRRLVRSEGEKSAGVAASRAGGGACVEPSAGTGSENKGAERTPIQLVHKGRYVTYWKRREVARSTRTEVGLGCSVSLWLASRRSIVRERRQHHGNVGKRTDAQEFGFHLSRGRQGALDVPGIGLCFGDADKRRVAQVLIL